MKPFLLFCIFIVFTCAACENNPSPSPGESGPPSVQKVVVEREKRDQEPPLPPEVKIRLRRDGKDNYSWELSGSDVDEIIKVNEKLRKKVGSEQTK